MPKGTVDHHHHRQSPSSLVGQRYRRRGPRGRRLRPLVGIGKAGSVGLDVSKKQEENSDHEQSVGTEEAEIGKEGDMAFPEDSADTNQPLEDTEAGNELTVGR